MSVAEPSATAVIPPVSSQGRNAKVPPDTTKTAPTKTQAAMFNRWMRGRNHVIQTPSRSSAAHMAPSNRASARNSVLR